MLISSEENAVDQALAIGIDIGATKIAAALVTEDGQALAERQSPTHVDQGPEAALARTASLVNELAASVDHDRLLGIGVGIAGQVDSRQGCVRLAVNLGWRDLPFVELLCTHLSASLPVWILTDAMASAVGEHIFGAGRGCRDFMYIGIGSGLGGGCLSNGQLLTGATGSASWIGHLVLDTDGLLCACGRRGCAETIVSGPGLLALARAYLEEKRYPTQLSPSADLTPAAILQAARNSDRLALAVLEEVGRSLGIVLAVCAALLNPARIIIGGGLGLAAFPFLLGAAQVELQRRVMPQSYQDLQILPSALSSPAFGAAALAWYFRGV
jgi:glucokinase